MAMGGSPVVAPDVDRKAGWSRLPEPWDLLVVGGGITGAGIAREAARAGFRTLLVERHDFASGTSSRSSKLVHGGLRYLASGQPRLTYESVRERERLVAELPGLVERIGFLLPAFRGDHPGRWTYEAGLTAYDILAAGRTHHRFYGRSAFELLAPHLRRDGLQGGLRYEDAVTDDARLTLRVIHEAAAAGAVTLNYVEVADVLTDARGRVAGAALRDAVSGETAEVRARVVVNATGARADVLRRRVGASPKIRPLRGSHIVFPAWRLPVAQAVSFLHVVDRRPVFAIPWEGATLYGTTDVDADLEDPETISTGEAEYLMTALRHAFPSLDIGPTDAISTLAGVRPVIGSGKTDPSKESRDHVVWEESGLLTVTGGKLTTFGLIARDAMRAIGWRIGANGTPARAPQSRVTADPASLNALDPSARRRLAGRYGTMASALVAAAAPDDLEPVARTSTLWAELRWAARTEAVVHLDDLLLRRTRLGLLLPNGGTAFFDRVRSIAQPELGWADERWAAEDARYRALWTRDHSTEALDGR